MFTIAFWMIPACLALIAGWLAYQVVLQNGRILLRLEAVELQLAVPNAVSAPAVPAGLPIGSLAPDFELPDLLGGRRALSQYRRRPVLLIFFNPACGFCTRMAPDLARLPIDGNGGRPLPLVVTTGKSEETRKLFEEHGVLCSVLVQERGEVASLYRAAGTPMGCLIDAEGRVASDLTAGADALLALVHRTSAATRNGRTYPPTPSRNGKGSTERGAQAQSGQAHPGNRSIAESRIERDGLSVGTLAPPFRLPRLDGGEISLQDFRGRELLLIFSDPHCGPCDALAPALENRSRGDSAVQVLMVSRGDSAENREKVKQHGITFPIALQKKWEVSKPYAMFATPIAYLIDENGIIASEVAVGVEPILSLLPRRAAAREKEVATMK